MASTAAG